MAIQIFFCYLLEDSGEIAGQIYHFLVTAFGESSILTDAKIANQPNSRELVKKMVTDCEAMLVLIGPKWFLCQDPQGKKRIQNPNELVCLEITTALGKEIFILPILVGDMRMPLDIELPEHLKPLALRSGLHIKTGASFPKDAQKLVHTLYQFFEIPDLAKKIEEDLVPSIPAEPLSPWQSDISPSPMLSKVPIPAPSQLVTPRAQSISDYVQVMNIRFFEDGEQARPVQVRQYQNQFIQNATRYVYCEITVTNLLYHKKAHTHSLVWKYVHSDGRQIGEISAEFNISPEWLTAWYQHGLGWKQPGNWALGNYLVHVFCDQECIGNEKFSIVSDQLTHVNYRNLYFELISIQFFEAGETIPAATERKYQTYFSQQEARYIYCEVKVINLLYGQAPHSHKLVWKYHRPDGTFWDQVVADFNILPEWYTAWHQRGWGWTTPGNWAKGTYSVKIYSDLECIGEEKFTIC